ncbi:sensor domain-containing diguanylate cyclase [Allorhizobium pseudoryzae]|uniref:sensor domain-containing diguanylate cyclase n=1 Tax=Allorhizobium pseudoryzae TaxID=379684 RepID=UPI003D0898C9
MLEALSKDGIGKEAFDRITSLVRDIFDVDVAAISLIEGGRQRFRSIQGLDLTDISLEDSFCRATWREGRPVVICDTGKSAEFHNHCLLTQKTPLRFYAGAVLRTSNGRPIGTICAIHTKPREFSAKEMRVMENLAQMASSEFELREFAYLDALTGALSRRHFLSECGRLCHLAMQNARDVSVVMLDVDHFKSVNDRFGHAAGDEVLRALVVACKADLRNFELVGRLGGEEFAVALQGSAEKAVAVSERLRRAVAKLAFTFDATTLRITSSFGVASVLPGEADISGALLRADKALYQAKAQGRDRVVRSNDQDQYTPASPSAG